MNAQDTRSTQTRVTAGVTFAARLAFEHISHSFGPNRETLNDVTLTAEPGEVLCLLGPSGSGKTTLLRIAAGIETADAPAACCSTTARSPGRRCSCRRNSARSAWCSRISRCFRT